MMEILGRTRRIIFICPAFPAAEFVWTLLQFRKSSQNCHIHLLYYEIMRKIDGGLQYGKAENFSRR